MSSWRKGAAALAGGVLLFQGASPVFASPDAAVQVLSFEQAAGLLEVTLLAPGGASGSLIIVFTIGGVQRTCTVPFVAEGGQNTFIQPLPAAAGKIIRVGIVVDDGDPF
jgi:hypothetical protein